MADKAVTLMNPPSNSMQRLVIETRMQQALDADFSGVKPQAGAGGTGAPSAKAYVAGDQIFFGPGSKNDPASQLMAHELTHVMQQKGGLK